jgi:tRNA (guanine37-N1)-methyltransferase
MQAAAFCIYREEMTINILTLFPKMFESVFSESIINRAVKNRKIAINIYNLRDWAKDKHKTVDDSPYGGGAGMVMKVDVIDNAIASLKLKTKNKKLKIILLTPQGKKFSQKKAEKLAAYTDILLICGHYEGFDERVRKLADEQISIGDYVLTGGEIPAMVITDAVSRLIPNVLGKSESHKVDSFSMENMVESKIIKSKIKNCLEYPQYTRPEEYLPISKKFKNPLTVPKILFSGNHEEIKKWRIKKSINKK